MSRLFVSTCDISPIYEPFVRAAFHTTLTDLTTPNGYTHENNQVLIKDYTRKTQNINNLISIPLVTNKNPPKSYDIPTILSTNIRSLPKKIDELQQIAELNSATVICITESWLSPDIPDQCVSIPGFNLFHRDSVGSSGGGVCVYLDKNTL